MQYQDVVMKKAVYTHHGVLFSPRKEGSPVIGDRIVMNVEDTMLSEVSQSW